MNKNSAPPIDLYATAIIACIMCLLTIDLYALAEVDADKKEKDDFSPVQTQQEFTASKQIEYTWTAHETERLRTAGNKCKGEGDYQQALHYYEESLAVRTEFTSLVDRADCLAHLGRIPEAVAILREVLTGHNEESIWGMLVDDLIKLKQFDNAYTSCDASQNDYLRGGNSFLLRSKVALAQGDSELSRKYLLNGYFHCKRYTTELVEIVDKLYRSGITPPDKVPVVTTGNEDVYAMIDFLRKIDQPLNERELAYLFKLNFTAVGYPTGQSSGHALSFVNAKSPIQTIDINIGADALIRCDVNKDLCSVHLEDLKSKYKYILASEDTKAWQFRELNLSQEEHVLILKCDDGFVLCDFGRSNSGELEAVTRLFDSHMHPKELLGPSALNNHYERVQKLLDNRDYKNAASELQNHWMDEYADAHTITSRHNMLLKKRDLLTDAYKDKPEIHSYLKNACLLFITQDIDKAKRFNVDLPTISEYKKHKWRLNAMVAAPFVKESEYNVWVETYPTCYVPQTSELFRNLYHQFGMIETLGTDPQYIPIAPIDRRLLDDAGLATELYSNKNK